MRRAQRGFTVVELMVVVAIIAILGALLIGMSGRTYGVNAANMSEQIVQTLNFTRTRALSTRRIHRVEIHFELSPVEIHIWQAATTGMNRTNIDSNAQFVERTIIPSSVTLFHAEVGAKPAGEDLSAVTQMTTQFDIDFLPNGSADVAGNTGGTDAATIYVTDASKTRDHRVLVYSATGSSYARTSW
jgi:prepilin-type N-terminal cleavage/methylation domain-containing protein